MDQPTYPASGSDRAGLTAVLGEHWPAAYRLAVGLCGRADAAAAVAARVLDRAVGTAPRWASAEQAARWFTRYTVLTARPLLRAGAESDDPGLAWLGPLPPQQREAVVLVHGLGLDLYRTAAAMDCSSRAAANHLAAAMDRVRRDGGTPDAWAAALPARLAAIVPPAAVVAADVDRVVRRRWRRTAVRRGVAAAVLMAIAWAGWRLWHVLVF